MRLDTSLRKLIKSHYDSGKSGAQIYKILNRTVKKRTIYNCINIIKTRNSIKAKKPSGIPRSVRTKAFINMVKRNVRINKRKKSARLIANEMIVIKKLSD